MSFNDRFRQRILRLSLADKRSLRAWLNTIIEAEETAPALPSANPGREVVEQQQVGRAVYQLELIKCGKTNCRCASGKLHGPYWYGYRRENGKLKSWYIGKRLKLEETDSQNNELD